MYIVSFLSRFSTYSNLYNHPTKIVEPTDSLKKQIKLSKKTGIPLGAVPGPVPKTLIQPPTNKGAYLHVDFIPQPSAAFHVHGAYFVPKILLQFYTQQVQNNSTANIIQCFQVLVLYPQQLQPSVFSCTLHSCRVIFREGGSLPPPPPPKNSLYE